MTRTNVDIQSMKNADNAAFGYELKEDVISKMDYYDIAGMSPAGSINSSVNDMTKWLMLWINNGKHNDKEIIASKYINEAISSQMVVAPNTPDKQFPNIHFANYGYGWFLQSYKGHYRVDHGGNIDGFSANVAFFPSDKIGIVVLTNQNGSAVPSLARNTIADFVLGLEKSDWVGRHKENIEKSKKAEKEAKDESETSNIENTKPSHILLDYTGTYSNEGYGSFPITVENDSLFAQLKLDRLYLNHVHYDTFELITANNGKVDTTEIGQSLKLTFNTNVAGDVANLSIEIEPTLDGILFERTPNSIDVDTEVMDSYVGEYELAGATIKVYVKNENVLYVFVPGQPEYELLPTAKHKFSFKTLEGFKLEFIEDENQDITKVRIIQPNGTFIANKK